MPRKQPTKKAEAKTKPAGAARNRRRASSAVGDAAPGAIHESFLAGQRTVLSLVADHRDLSDIAGALERLFVDMLGAVSATFVVFDGQDWRRIAPHDAGEDGNRIAGCTGLAGRIAKSVKSWGKPLKIEADEKDPDLAPLARILDGKSGAMGWALPIGGPKCEEPGCVFLRFDAARRLDVAARQALELLEPLTRVAVNAARDTMVARAADERFATLAATIPGVVYQRVVRPDGDIRYTYISEGARDLFGVDPETVLSDPQALFQHYAPEYRDTFRQRLLEASKTLALWDVEAQIVTPEGEEKWTHAIARPQRQPDGTVVWNGVILAATRIKQVELELRRAKEEAEASSRMQAELLEKLQSADERLSSLAATIPGVVYQRLVTPDGDIRYTYISEGARDLFGVEPEDVLNDPNVLFKHHGPEYRKTFRDRLIAASKAMTLWDVEAQIVTADGQEKWTHALARPHRRDDGSVLWNGVILDATRIKEAEFAAAAAEERTRAAIVESISQGIAIFDPEDCLITWNSTLLDLFPGLDGAIREGAAYRTILQAEADGCVEPDGTAPKAQLLRDRLSRHDNQESSVERRLADGRWILINERRSDAGTIVLYTDVTDLKRREEQLQLAKNRAEQANVELEKTIRRLDIALGNMTQGLCLFDSQLHSILCNRRYAKIFRLPPELTGPGASLHAQISHVAAQGKADEAEAVALVDDRLSYAASRARCTYRLALPDKRIIEVIHQPLPDGGAVETFTEVAADAPQALVFSGKEEGAATNGAAAPGEGRDESGDSAAALALARDEARSADRGKAEFLRAFGHALKASLETIVDTSEAMTGAVYGPLGDERYRQFAKSIRDSGNALMSMIDDIEEISTLTAGEIELSEQQLDLGQLLARCIRLARHSADGEPPSISIAAPCEGYRIRADETKLRQAFLNLLSNAVRFTPAKGRIEVSIDAADDGGLAVAIADTGGGVPAKIISALMGRAEAGNGARLPNGKDSHLGLPVVKSLIERHGGRLVLDSAKGKGTTAVVHIPDSRVLSRPDPAGT